MDKSALPNQEIATIYNWRTPPAVFRAISDLLGPFDLDAAADDENALCRRYFTQETDGLAQDWGSARVWCNPPYGRELGAWARKFAEASLAGAYVVALIPPSVAAVWWRRYVVESAAEIWFLTGRIQFDPPPDRPLESNRNRYDNAVIVYRPGRRRLGYPIVRWWDWRLAVDALEAGS